MKTIEGGINFIASQQLPNGNFTSQSSASRQAWQPDYSYQTNFTPALMLASLSSVPGTEVIRDKLATFLLQQKSPVWSYNYWAEQTTEHSKLPYPDDLDDTFCALIGLYLHDQKLVTAEGLAQIVKVLIATESKPGGPYRTWLVPSSSPVVWKDIDLAVNANINYFLSLVGQRLPNLNSLIKTAIDTQQLHSPYYPSALPLLYYLSRSCSPSDHAALQKVTLRIWHNIQKPSALETALILTTLCQLHAPSPILKKLSQTLQSSQNSDGSWSADGFCLDPTRRQKTYYSGCAALTTAFCLEALGLYQNQVTLQQQLQTRMSSRVERLQTKIVDQATKRFVALGPELRQQAIAMLNRQLADDTNHEVTLLPFLFAQSLRTNLQLPDELFIQLGLANLYGWIAYTIYDDFLDDEGQPSQLSVANVALRSSLLSFQRALPNHRQFQRRVEQTFDIIDSANTWEIAHCRFAVSDRMITLQQLPRYARRAKLAERSLGHGLTPLAVLAASGIDLRDPQVQVVDKAFRNYLIVRQLNDDAHDWKQDLARGHITYVVSRVLQPLKLQGQQSISQLLPQLDNRFWYHDLSRICKVMESHITRGQQQLAQQQLLEPDNLVVRLLQSSQNLVQTTLSSQKQTVDFLVSYSSATPRNIK